MKHFFLLIATILLDLFAIPIVAYRIIHPINWESFTVGLVIFALGNLLCFRSILAKEKPETEIIN